MSDDRLPQLETPDDVQVLENVLDDVPASAQTRRSILKQAALGVAAVGVLGPAGSALAAGERVDIVGAENPVKVAVGLRTAEALANVFLAEAIVRAKGKPAAAFVPILRGAGGAEFDHYRDLTNNTPAGKQAIPMKFWIPEAAFGTMAADFFNVVETLETLFVNGYLIFTTSLATAATKTPAGKMRDFFIRYSRISGEILGTESEHRVLARFAASKTGGSKPGGIPNNKGFETFTIHSIEGIVQAIESLGVGLGKQGKSPGKFYTFDGKKSPQFSSIIANYSA